MKYNNNYTIKDLFMNKELKGLFPQFTQKDSKKSLFSFEWIDKKVCQYIKSAFNGRMSNGEIVIKGKYKQRYNEIKAMKSLIEDMVNNIPSLTRNLRSGSKLVTPFMSIDQLKQLTEPEDKIKVMQIVLDNIKYNPDFQNTKRGYSFIKDKYFFKQQEKWLSKVNYDKLRRN